MLQRNGFSRETLKYIRTYSKLYVVMMPNSERKLRKLLFNCICFNVQKETADIIVNIPELFVD